MTVLSISTRVIDSFDSFVQARSRKPYRPTTIAGYIEAWMVSGDGVRVYAGDYDIYLLAVISIIDEWNRDPSLIDPPVTRIFEDRRDRLDEILDPLVFATWTFDTLHPRQASD